jgi:hypothetical protein
MCGVCGAPERTGNDERASVTTAHARAPRKGRLRMDADAPFVPITMPEAPTTAACSSTMSRASPCASRLVTVQRPSLAFCVTLGEAVP